MAGEVKNPKKTFPAGLFYAVILTCVSYIIPLVAVTGAVVVEQHEWDSGFMAVAAEMIAGKWLKIWIDVGAVLSAVGLFEALLSSCAFQIVGMADLAFLPEFFQLRSRWFDTPWFGDVVRVCFVFMASEEVSDVETAVQGARKCGSTGDGSGVGISGVEVDGVCKCFCDSLYPESVT
ncbi:hypothetical protein L1987_67426 [Smallanthus sonchifolius]|uniref:Uncharacterized protein n=1 Tax=Smallanthus sonchifolius TaxID=185202 RepID=A0ACB9B3I2_9ASTR|nr:hypothetical protein L1987_67426 [Smallanthus sonchifolius]